jgi:hypothetical protein
MSAPAAAAAPEMPDFARTGRRVIGEEAAARPQRVKRARIEIRRPRPRDDRQHRQRQADADGEIAREAVADHEIMERGRAEHGENAEPREGARA